ncbi:MAG: hypothetical protein RLZZ550_2000 [Verrucomicrobiota bacterium]|jgi:hypothetical protein
MRRSLVIAALLAGLGSAACFLGFRATPATLDAQGVLHEPFGLLPVGWLCGGLAVLLLALARVFRK